MSIEAQARGASRIVHLGLGAFFRAHAAIYVQEANASSTVPWEVVGVSLRSAQTRDVLAENDWSYTAVELSPNGMKAERVDILSDVLVAPEDHDRVMAYLADPCTRIVTLTITEKGYCYDPVSQGLNGELAEIQADLRSDAPVSAPGYLVKALEIRRSKGLAPFTIMSLDNMPVNGMVTKSVVCGFASLKDQSLGAWIEDTVAFPSTMVDRIVPATTPDAIAALEERFGFCDKGMVQHEPFRQWVIEDEFVDNQRPEFDRAGAQFVMNVEPFEHMKLRMLNGAHSALAYLGALLGHETIHQAISNELLARFVRSFWRHEVIPTLAPSQGTDFFAYAKTLEQRFANPAIQHKTTQIAMDGSAKLPQRIVQPLAENLKAKRSCPLMVSVLAGWIHFLGGKSVAGAPLPLVDPQALPLKRALAEARTPFERSAKILAFDEIFGALQSEMVQPQLAKTLEGFEIDGVQKTLEGVLR